ncbi:MAG TPA: MarR family transcriptional regulator [Paraburkholderia sp.]|jgi:DNA-binding MarR family transcriptional regulator|nr:MarR family transcriptional regulator [Paraburkholderia sp.]
MTGTKRAAHEAADAASEDGWLATPDARAALPVRRKPYWHPLDIGRHLGYYKGARCGTWHARIFIGNGRYEETRLGKADDSRDADGIAILDYPQAVARSHAWWDGRTTHAPRAAGVGRRPSDSWQSRVRTDQLDEIARAWQRERPDLDLSLVGFFIRLRQVNYLHERRLAGLADSLGLNVGELHVVMALRRAGAPYAMRPTDLFTTLLVTSGAISKRIGRLEEMGIVTRVAGDDDLRSWHIILTRRGVALADAAMVRIADRLAAVRAATGLTIEEFAAADAYLRILLGNTR